jgi:F-type H+-transporting ATPase subunit epsilon
MKMINFELTTPERIAVKKDVDQVTLPTREGEISVLPGHVPLVAVLVPGIITLASGKDEEYLAVSGGFIEVQPESRVIVLADTAERAEELDLEKVEEARQRAQKLLADQRGMDDVSAAAMMAELNRELARLKVIHKGRSRRKPPTMA